MASLIQNHVGQFIDENRKYWPLPEILPSTGEAERSSLYFILHNKEWRLCAQRKCACSDSPLSLSIFGDKDVTDQFNVRMGICGESRVNIVEKNADEISTDEFCCADFVRISVLNLIMQSNNLFIFFVEIEQKAKLCKRKFGTDYKEILLSGKKTDLVINVKDRKFNCHSIILGARSPVFSAMLEHDMKEKRDGEVVIPDTDPSVFQDFLLYLYTGEGKHLKCEYIADLYRLADKYCVDDMKYYCVEQMKHGFPIENFFDVFLLSQQQSDSELTETAIKYFLENSGDIIGNEKWIEFMNEYPGETHTLIKALAKPKRKCGC